MSTPRSYPADQCPPWLDTVIADWVGWANVDRSLPIDTVDAAAFVLAMLHRNRIRSAVLDDREETEQTCDTMAALADLAEHLRLLGLDGDAAAVTLCDLLLSKLEDDLDWLEKRHYHGAIDSIMSSIAEITPRPWAAINPAELWSSVALWTDDEGEQLAVAA